jgi:glutathione peroxidase
VASPLAGSAGRTDNRPLQPPPTEHVETLASQYMHVRVVLGFPCDQFGHQEPGNEAEIRNFCSLTYEVDFPMFAKVDVNGDGAHPLWKWLKDEKGGFLGLDAIKWNFSKFLVGRDGRVIARYAPTDKPESLVDDIEAALG